jgi:hypothetical protein
LTVTFLENGKFVIIWAPGFENIFLLQIDLIINIYKGIGNQLEKTIEKIP